MKLRGVIFGMIIALLFTEIVLANEHSELMEEADSYEESLSDAVEVGNKICPVSGGNIVSMGREVKFEYKGKIYNFCCDMCVKSFKKDPEKYIKIIEKEMRKKSKDKVSSEEGNHGHSGHNH